MCLCDLLISANKFKIVRYCFKINRNIMEQASSKSRNFEEQNAAKVDQGLLKKWEEIQNKLKDSIVTSDSEEWQMSAELSGLKLVAGLDISYPKDAHDKGDSEAYAAVVICNFPSLEIAYQEVQLVQLDAPYVPGFLAFRESTPLLNLLKKVLEAKPDLKPDVLLVDGNGILHPQKCGVACHIGIHMNIPTIGVAKNLFVMEGVDYTKNMSQDFKSVGDYDFIRDNENNVLGMALKTSEKAKNAVYVSIGHNISLETARKTVLTCCKFRVPEPIRFADFISREYIRKENNKTLKPGACSELENI